MTNNKEKTEFDTDVFHQKLATVLTVTCVRNTIIEQYHAGKFPVSKTGDYSDVKVITPEGEIPWNEVSRISDEEMKAFNKQVSNRLFSFLQYMYNHKYARDRDDFLTKMEFFSQNNWDTPKMDSFFTSLMKNTSNREESFFTSM